MTKKAFVFWGGWDGHEPEVCAHRYEKFLAENGFEVTVSQDLQLLCNTEFMQTLNLICPIITMSEISAEQSLGLRTAIKAGTGLAGHHGGMGDAFRNDTEYQFMVGGQFICHPGNIIDYTVEVSKDDELTAGISNFTMKSEQYFMHVDPSNDVILHTHMIQREEAPWIAGTKMPVAWKRKYGEGKVFYSALGHVDSDFETSPEAWTVLQRGLLWSAR